MELLNSFNNSFRELPVDCPVLIQFNKSGQKDLTTRTNSITTTNDALNQTLINSSNNIDNNNDNNNIETIVHNIDFLNESSDQIVSDILNNYSQCAQSLPSRQTFVKSSSLSTIAEEKTLTNTQSHSISQNASTKNREKNVNEIFVIEKLLDEFQGKNFLINEIINVFEPSSKSGNFKRNVPIRFFFFNFFL
jgi:hypothetical protein